MDEVSDDQLLAWIVGRRLIGSTFPEKASAEATEEYVEDLGYQRARGSRTYPSAPIGAKSSELPVWSETGKASFSRHWRDCVPFKGSVDVNGEPYSSSAAANPRQPICLPTAIGRA